MAPMGVRDDPRVSSASLGAPLPRNAGYDDDFR